MNVGRGLFRGWIFLTVLWLIGAGTLAYFIIGDEVSGWKWQHVEIKRDKDIPPWETDWKRHYYEIMRSPSAEKLAVSFEKLGYSSWNKHAEEDGRIVIIKMPDHSSLYLDAQLTEDDQQYSLRHSGISAGRGTLAS
jgi:hypothetical protein